MEVTIMRTATWSTIGTKVDTCADIAQVLEKSGLNYKVSKSKIQLPNGIEIPDRMATVKEDGSYIGVVSNGYEICQNEDAFDFANNIEGIEFEKAGETGTGMVYIIGKLPDVTVLGDTFTPHLILQNSHNGRYTLKATICPLRFVCQNQFSISFRNMKNSVTIRHSRQLASKIAQAKQLLNQTASYMSEFKGTAEDLARIKVSDTNLYHIVDKFFDMANEEMTERQRREVEERRSAFFKCYNADDNQNFLGTGWGIANAMSDYVTHRNRKQTAGVNDTRFLDVTFDNMIMPKLIQAVKEVAR
jgi:phage/plasmid-like protein (TIGR03299 family)